MGNTVQRCECGCGLAAPTSPYTDSRRDYVKGEPGIPGRYRDLVDEIREKYAAGTSTYAIAKEYSMGRAAAWKICTRRSYA